MTFTFTRAAAVALLTAATLAGSTAPSHAAEPTTCDEVVAALTQDQKRVSSANAAVRRDSAAVKKAQSAAKKAKTPAGRKKTRAAVTRAKPRMSTALLARLAADTCEPVHREISIPATAAMRAHTTA